MHEGPVIAHRTALQPRPPQAELLEGELAVPGRCEEVPAAATRHDLAYLVVAAAFGEDGPGRERQEGGDDDDDDGDHCRHAVSIVLGSGNATRRAAGRE